MVKTPHTFLWEPWFQAPVGNRVKKLNVYKCECFSTDKTLEIDILKGVYPFDKKLPVLSRN